MDNWKTRHWIGSALIVWDITFICLWRSEYGWFTHYHGPVAISFISIGFLGFMIGIACLMPSQDDRE